MSESPQAPRTVVIGLDADARSTVVRVDSELPGGLRPTGSTVHELWRQERVPAGREDAERRPDPELDPRPPVAGVSIRRLVLPPESSENRVDDTLHRTGSLYVGTVLSGSAYLLLETGEVLLSLGDTFVLPDSMHAWRNPFDTAAEVVSTVFPLLPS